MPSKLDLETGSVELQGRRAISESEFDAWVRPSRAVRLLTSRGLDQEAAIGVLISRLSADIVSAVAEHVVWKPVGGEVEKRAFCAIPSRHWNAESEWLPEATLWNTGDIYFDILDAVGYDVRIQGRIRYFGVRFDPADIESVWQSIGDEQPTADLDRPSGGRRLSDRWKPWIAELAAYIHDEGVPDGIGSQGQEELINAIANRLAARGVEPLSRATVQSTAQAVLDRLRSAGN